MSAERLVIAIFVLGLPFLAACCIGLARRVDEGRAPPKGARLR